MITVFCFGRSSEVLNNIILRSKCYLLYKRIFYYFMLMVRWWGRCGQFVGPLLLMNGPITKLNTIFFRRVVDELELRNWSE